MSTCFCCENYSNKFMSARDDGGAYLGSCNDGFSFPQQVDNHFEQLVWADFPACRRFKAKKHWSDIAVERILEKMREWYDRGIRIGFNEDNAQIIREEAEKAGVK